MSEEKPEGWYVDISETVPPRLLGGERNAVLLGAFVVGSIAMEVAPRSGDWAIGVYVIAIVIWGIWTTALAIAWRHDPRLIGLGDRSELLDGTLSRFLRYPQFISAHSHGAPDRKRSAERKRRHLKR